MNRTISSQIVLLSTNIEYLMRGNKCMHGFTSAKLRYEDFVLFFLRHIIYYIQSMCICIRLLKSQAFY